MTKEQVNGLAVAIASAIERGREGEVTQALVTDLAYSLGHVLGLPPETTHTQSPFGEPLISSSAVWRSQAMSYLARQPLRAVEVLTADFREGENFSIVQSGMMPMPDNSMLCVMMAQDCPRDEAIHLLRELANQMEKQTQLSLMEVSLMEGKEQ